MGRNLVESTESPVALECGKVRRGGRRDARGRTVRASRSSLWWSFSREEGDGSAFDVGGRAPDPQFAGHPPRTTSTDPVNLQISTEEGKAWSSSAAATSLERVPPGLHT
jgi:hypothetical protein